MEAHGYAPPKALAENLWEIRGQWSNKFGRRMTIVRLTNGDVFIHSAIRLEPSDLSWLKSLGPVRGIVAPNKFHCSDAPWMAGEFPEATLYVPTRKMAAFASLGLKPSDLASDFPTDIGGELECVPMQGTRIDESALIHHSSRTLILCDLAMNMEDVFTGVEGAFMRWNGVGGRFGVTRLTKFLFTSDKKALVASYLRVLDRDFDRVVVSHGAVLEGGGREQLKKAVTDLFGVP
jgi:hypothetical protein